MGKEKGGDLKKNCTNCFFAEFDKTESGRRNLNWGDCKFEIDLPHSFMNLYRELPQKVKISKSTQPNCPLWKKDTR